VTLQLPHQWLEDEKLRQNFEKIAVEWPQPTTNWTEYTATVASTSVTLGTGGTNVARYQKHGRTVHVAGLITLGTGGVFTGAACTIALENLIRIPRKRIIHRTIVEHRATISIS